MPSGGGAMARRLNTRGRVGVIVKRRQIDPLHGTAPLDAVAVNRLDHDSLAARFAKHFGNAITVSHECPAGWSTAHAGSGVFRRHRTRRILQHV
jgi:hypothetical protein